MAETSKPIVDDDPFDTQPAAPCRRDECPNLFLSQGLPDPGPQARGISGLELQRQLLAARIKLPVIFITVFHDQQTTEEAKKLGAIG